ncbi:MAG: isoleucine--tRNA ligase [Candidatus Aenigmarchaeota archaeon]|nr:isoleucine--tRNA ligase [Candidatus Aenigmarchaeota archaeon]
MNPQKEQEIQEFWNKNASYQKAKALRSKGKKFYFLDGPPYATGAIHMGTAWNKVLKDAYIRYFRMRGFNVRDQPGYDTHGMPIENKVEKELGLTSKPDIEKLGVETFIKKCREFATKYIGVMNSQFIDLGVWMDFSKPYLTLDKEYIEGGWATFKTGFEKGLLYQGFYPVHVCPHCQTAVAYNEIEYMKATDPSVYVKFKVNGKAEYLVIWTTTPWTLPANAGVMVHPEEEYARVQAGKDILIIAKPLVSKVMEKAGIADFKILETFKGKKLEGVQYEHPLKDKVTAQQKIQGRVILSSHYVTMEDGTGLVHTAPGHGEEDYKAGKEAGLPIISPVNMDGTYNEEAGDYKGLFVKKANKTIIEDLSKKGALLKEESYTHDYPKCWRCSSPLLEMAVKQWFFRVTEIRKKLMEENEQVNWQPAWAKKRFANWLESLSDWPISRQRYWGIPLPIWTCECGETKVVGSADELPVKIQDLHRPYVDEILLPCKCGKKMKRIPDVLDVWFDSGLAAWASLGYPKNKEEFKNWWPCDFQTEGPDQIRGWWNSQLITSVITFNQRPFNNILFHGFVLDAHGIKMSKSKGNVVDPFDVVKKHGRDVLRYYLLHSPPWDDFYFKWLDVDEIAKSFIVIENTFNFLKTYVPDANHVTLKKAEDRWIISRLNTIIREYNRAFSAYEGHKAIESLHDFLLNDFSRWYIKLVRERTWPAYEGSDKKEAFYALYEVARKSAILLAPVCPFIAEKAYQDVLKPLGSAKESVHHEDMPEADEKLIDEKLELDMQIAKGIVETASFIRQENKIKLRWPLAALALENIEISKDIYPVIEGMSNVKAVTKTAEGYAKKPLGEGFVSLDVNLTEELKAEALYREVVRKIQQMRKNLGMKVEDHIILSVSRSALKAFEDQLKRQVGAKKINYSTEEGDEVDFEGEKLLIHIKKA